MLRLLITPGRVSIYIYIFFYIYFIYVHIYTYSSLLSLPPSLHLKHNISQTPAAIILLHIVIQSRDWSWYDTQQSPPLNFIIFLYLLLFFFSSSSSFLLLFFLISLFILFSTLRHTHSLQQMPHSNSPKSKDPLLKVWDIGQGNEAIYTCDG